MPTDLAPGNCLDYDLPRGSVDRSTKFIDGFADSSVYGTEIMGHYQLYIYTLGECLLCNEKGEKLELRDGDYNYDPITGKMQIGITFNFLITDVTLGFLSQCW